MYVRDDWLSLIFASFSHGMYNEVSICNTFDTLETYYTSDTNDTSDTSVTNYASVTSYTSDTSYTYTYLILPNIRYIRYKLYDLYKQYTRYFRYKRYKQKYDTCDTPDAKFLIHFPHRQRLKMVARYTHETLHLGRYSALRRRTDRG
jgi:hypothetical protein